MPSLKGAEIANQFHFDVVVCIDLKSFQRGFHDVNLYLYFGLQETDRVAAALALGPLKGLEAPSIDPVNLTQASKAMTHDISKGRQQSLRWTQPQ